MDVSPYISFGGTSGRKYFWISIPVAIGAAVVATFLLGVSIGIWVSFGKLFGFDFAPVTARRLGGQLGSIFFGPMVLILMSLFSVRRFHDRGKSGYWALILFAPPVGFIWYFVECGLFPGSPEANRYGHPLNTINQS